MTDLREHSGDDMDDAALTNWKSDALERRSARKNKGARAAFAAFREWPMWQRLLVLVPSALVLLLVLGGVVDAIASVGRIHPGVEAGGVPVGGLTVAKAEARISSALDERFHDPVTVVYEEQTWQVSADQLGATADARSAADAAFAVGRGNDTIEALGQRMVSWFRPVRVRVPVSSDTSMTTAVLDNVSVKIDREPKDATIVIEDLEPSIVPSELGVAVRREELRDDILVALASSDRTVRVRVDSVPVLVTDAGAQDALEQTRVMLSGPVEVTHEAEVWQFTAKEIAGWVAFRPVRASEATGSGSTSSAVEATRADSSESTATTGAVLEAYIDSVEASKTISPRVGGAGRPAVDATFKVVSGSVSIVPSQDGIGPDIESLARELSIVLKGAGVRRVALLTQRVEPDRTTQDARGMGIKERISTYTTTFEAGNKPRVNNIHTLADAINGTLIPPGGTFSFNGTVGPRTAAKGYQEAPAIVQGKLVPQLGGGICQVGTTLFNSVYESGLPVLERKNHSFYISHYPKGRDATVSWGGPDFKFKNDTSSWVLLATGYSSSSLTISLYGTDPGYEVKSSVGPWTDVKPHPTREVPDPTLPVGKKVIEDSGIDGRTIVVKRTVTKNGAIVREDTFKSVYRTTETVVRVGTKPIAGQVPTVTPTP